MGTGHGPAGKPVRSPEPALDAQAERFMEKLLATCLSLPRDRIEAAIDKTCIDYPHFALQLRQRYDNLLRRGFLEDHESTDQEGEASE